MGQIDALLILVAMFAPLAGALLTTGSWCRSQTRLIANLCAGVSLAACLELLRAASSNASGIDFTWFHVDLLAAIPMTLFAGLTLALLVVGPSREINRTTVQRILILQFGTLLVYSTSNLLLLLAGWVVSGLAWKRDERGPASTGVSLPKIALGASSFFVAVAVALVFRLRPAGGSGEWYSLRSLADLDADSAFWVLGALMLAVLLGKGIFPFHTWITSAFEEGPLLLTVLLANTHVGAYLVARLVVPLLPQAQMQALPIMSSLALLTAVYTAIVAVAEPSPRRILALLSASQASFILAGLESAHMEGRSGALALWIVVSIATTGLVAIYSMVEARLRLPFDTSRYHGLASQMPRLAVFFIVFGLALVGLPGTFGFCAESLLVHGTMESRPLVGVILPLATALNGLNIFRLFARLFLGSSGVEFSGVPDARPRERWVLVAGTAWLLWTGLVPGPVMSQIARAATSITASPQAASASGGINPPTRIASQSAQVR